MYEYRTTALILSLPLKCNRETLKRGTSLDELLYIADPDVSGLGDNALVNRLSRPGGAGKAHGVNITQ